MESDSEYSFDDKWPESENFSNQNPGFFDTVSKTLSAMRKDFFKCSKNALDLNTMLDEATLQEFEEDLLAIDTMIIEVDAILEKLQNRKDTEEEENCAKLETRLSRLLSYTLRYVAMFGATQIAGNAILWVVDEDPALDPKEFWLFKWPFFPSEAKAITNALCAMIATAFSVYVCANSVNDRFSKIVGNYLFEYIDFYRDLWKKYLWEIKADNVLWKLVLPFNAIIKSVAFLFPAITWTIFKPIKDMIKSTAGNINLLLSSRDGFLTVNYKIFKLLGHVITGLATFCLAMVGKRVFTRWNVESEIAKHILLMLAVLYFPYNMLAIYYSRYEALHCFFVNMGNAILEWIPDRILLPRLDLPVVLRSLEAKSSKRIDAALTQLQPWVESYEINLRSHETEKANESTELATEIQKIAERVKSTQTILLPALKNSMKLALEMESQADQKVLVLIQIEIAKILEFWLSTYIPKKRKSKFVIILRLVTGAMFYVINLLILEFYSKVWSCVIFCIYTLISLAAWVELTDCKPSSGSAFGILIGISALSAFPSYVTYEVGLSLALSMVKTVIASTFAQLNAFFIGGGYRKPRVICETIVKDILAVVTLAFIWFIAIYFAATGAADLTRNVLEEFFILVPTWGQYILEIYQTMQATFNRGASDVPIISDILYFIYRVIIPLLPPRHHSLTNNNDVADVVALAVEGFTAGALLGPAANMITTKSFVLDWLAFKFCNLMIFLFGPIVCWIANALKPVADRVATSALVTGIRSKLTVFECCDSAESDEEPLPINDDSDIFTIKQFVE